MLPFKSRMDQLGQLEPSILQQSTVNPNFDVWENRHKTNLWKRAYETLSSDEIKAYEDILSRSDLKAESLMSVSESMEEIMQRYQGKQKLPEISKIIKRIKEMSLGLNATVGFDPSIGAVFQQTSAFSSLPWTSVKLLLSVSYPKSLHCNLMIANGAALVCNELQ